MIARLAPISRWTERIKGAAMVGALCLAAASGYAFAIGPTIDVNRTFAGSVNLVGATLSSTSSVYTVPGGKQLTLTDVIVAAVGQTGTRAQMFISSDSGCSIGTVVRLNDVKVPEGGTLHLPLVTGFGFGPGKTVCIFTDEDANWTLRGYLTNET